MPFQLSPGVVTTEIDLTTVIPAVSTTNGGFVGDFSWGPANTVVTIDSESTLASVFGRPDSNTYIPFLTAASFLAYGNNLKIVRPAHPLSRNAVTGNAAPRIENQDVWFNTYRGTPTTTGGYGNTTPGFIAKYTGEIGNALSVAYCPANASIFTSWAYKNYFDGAPGTSSYAARYGSSNDQIHIVVIDRRGDFSVGAQNYAYANTDSAASPVTVLEVFPYMSVAADAKNEDGSTNFYVDVLAEKSKYINWISHPANTTNWGTLATGGTTFSQIANLSVTTANSANLSGGAYFTSTNGEDVVAWDKFRQSDEVDVSLLITGDASPAVAQHVIDNVAEFRRDCVAFISPAQANVVNNMGGETTAITTQKNTNINRSSSYAVFDSGWKYMFDKYNSQYRWVPLNGDIAGLCVRTDTTRDPWFSPAGFNRGQIKNIVKLAWNPNKTARDELYKIGVNPVATFAGEGTILFGDKTMLTRPSAFDRINVRRLFIVLEKAIATAAKYSLFEFNDEFTRSQFVSLVDPFLRDVQGRRGIFDYRVVCDESNNTPEVIDRNEFVGDIYIKPARSINFIQLNFVAVRTGVSFDEIVGRF
jgi:phage tail sheath protein FI